MRRYVLVTASTSASLLKSRLNGAASTASTRAMTAPRARQKSALRRSASAMRSGLPAPRFWPTKGPMTADMAKNTTRLSASMRVAAPYPATARSPKPASRATMMPAEMGMMTLVPAAGSPTCRMRFQERHTVAGEHSGEHSSCMRWITNAPKASVTTRAITEASAAPASSRRGKPSKPKISSGSRIRLMAADVIIRRACSRVSPVARTAPITTIGTRTSANPANHMSM